MATRLFRIDPREERIAAALRNVDVTSLGIWKELEGLSSHTRIDSAEVPVEGVVIGPDNRFSAIINLYLLLRYERDGEQGFTESESFLAKVSGRLDDDVPVIEGSNVDTSSFYP